MAEYNSDDTWIRSGSQQRRQERFWPGFLVLLLVCFAVFLFFATIARPEVLAPGFLGELAPEPTRGLGPLGVEP